MRIIVEKEARDPQSMIDRDYELLGELANNVSDPITRIWTNRQCLVVGRQVSRWQGYDAACGKMTQEGWPVIRRATGGTIVPHYEGVLNVSLLYPVMGNRKSYVEQYLALCTPIIAVLKEMGIKADIGPVTGAYCNGEFNVAIDGKKVAGTAQRWKKIIDPSWPNANVVLVHACINIADYMVGVNAVNNFIGEMLTSKKRSQISATAHTDIETASPNNFCSVKMLTKVHVDQFVDAIVRQFVLNKI